MYSVLTVCTLIHPPLRLTRFSIDLCLRTSSHLFIFILNPNTTIGAFRSPSATWPFRLPLWLLYEPTLRFTLSTLSLVPLRLSSWGSVSLAFTLATLAANNSNILPLSIVVWKMTRNEWPRRSRSCYWGPESQPSSSPHICLSHPILFLLSPSSYSSFSSSSSSFISHYHLRSGKTTVLKQMQIVHNRGGFTAAQKEHYRQQVNQASFIFMTPPFLTSASHISSSRLVTPYAGVPQCLRGG